MAYTFNLTKPDNIKLTLERLKTRLAATKGKLTGDEEEGTISAEGFEGKYMVEADTIEITITKKPLSMLPNKLLEKQIRGIFKEIAAEK